MQEDTSFNRRSSQFGSAAGSPQAPARFPFIYDNNRGLINIKGYTGPGGAVTIPETINGFPVTSIENAFIDCGTLESVKIPDSVTRIGVDAFSGCSSLESVTIPNGVMNISDGAFSDCEGLTSVTIPDNITRIERDTFIFCSSLTNLTVPAKVTSIGDSAFAHCTSLKKIYFKGDAPDLGNNVFDGDNNTIIYYLPGTTGWGATFGGCPTAPWKQ